MLWYDKEFLSPQKWIAEFCSSSRLRNKFREEMEILISLGWFSLHLNAGARAQQDPGATLGMNGVSERRHVRPALIGPSLRMTRERDRKRQRERESDQTGVFAGSGNGLFFTIAFYSFYTLTQNVFKVQDAYSCLHRISIISFCFLGKAGFFCFLIL